MIIVTGGSLMYDNGHDCTGCPHIHNIRGTNAEKWFDSAEEKAEFEAVIKNDARRVAADVAAGMQQQKGGD